MSEKRKCVACGVRTDKGKTYDNAFDEEYDEVYGEFYCNECMESE